MTWQAVKTNKGLALDQKLVISGGQLALTKAGAGTAVHASGTLAEQTALSGPTSNAVGLSPYRRNSATQITVPVTISNDEVTTSYTAKQIGIFATDPDDGEILYMIAEDSTGQIIPTATQSVGFLAVWNFSVAISNSTSVTVTASGLLTADDAEATYSKLDHTHAYSTLTGLPTIPEAVTVDSELSNSSTNPVQNAVITTALGKKGNSQIIVAQNVSVTQNSWVADNTYTGYSYKADVTVNGVTADYIPEVCFSNADAVSGKYCPVCASGSGVVSIYSTTQEAITIPSIVCTKRLV